ncbi:winged helix-turn-helix transcriptional regulator [Deinococcus maricopensis]|uniref:Transcriptional regulator, HxlR family n=1 Tax=Deinococcus maricopensis (strain DSM 21211 / LMG 22137 / NRRL B-23946 / LB-34) TaxID=709986 RepID=E8UA03_DEIML|nr:helix-turn-helix domain-containing protein [Deinococcus maricopensis]ADV67892.1 transcriptional regulator, HxlR family [Deinococcus maricopensis DSM 21211]
MKPPRALNCAPGCPVEVTLEVISGRWKCVILYHLLRGPVRFGQLRRLIPGVTQRMLTLQLRELEADGLVERTAYPQVPPRVDYRLTPLGESLRAVVLAMLAWGEANHDTVMALRGGEVGGVAS